MALVECSECGRSVSSRAAACPGCGCPVDDASPRGPEPEELPTLVSEDAFVEHAKTIVVTAESESGEPPRPPPSAWRIAEPAPWSRYFARSVDLLVFGLMTLFVVSLVAHAALPLSVTAPLVASLDNPAVSAMVVTALAMPLCALFVGTVGFTPGKWLFGIRVLDPLGHPIGVWAAFGREVQVWLRGMGMGIPLVALVTHIVAYQTLATKGHSSWDEPAHVAVRYRNHTWLTHLRWALGLFVLILVLAIIRAIK